MQDFDHSLAKGSFVKVCGVSRSEDAQECHLLGVDAIGVLLHKPDKKPAADMMTVEAAVALVKSLPVGLASVLLIHVLDGPFIASLCSEIRPTAIQIQSQVSREHLGTLRMEFPTLRVIKTFGVGDGLPIDQLIREIRQYRDLGLLDVALLDSPRRGHGETHDWALSAEVVRQLPDIPIVLAGGLNAANVGNAINQVKPKGLDVMSSVTAPSRDRKDTSKIKEFMDAVKTAKEGL